MTIDPRSDVTPAIAAHVLYELDGATPNAMKAGSFIRALINAIRLADTVNKLKLGLGYPGYVQAVDIYQNQSGGYAELESIAAQIVVYGSTTETEKTT